MEVLNWVVRVSLIEATFDKAFNELIYLLLSLLLIIIPRESHQIPWATNTHISANPYLF